MEKLPVRRSQAAPPNVPDGQPPPERPDHTRAAVLVALTGFVMLGVVFTGGWWAALGLAPALLALRWIIATIKQD